MKRLCLALLLCCAGLPAAAALPAMLADGTPMPSLAPVMEEVTPAVVNIATYTTVQVSNPLFNDPFFRRFFDLPDNRRRTRRTRSAGSGVIVDAAGGYIVTNNHVISRADEIAVTLSDGTTLPAELVGADAQADLAVLRVELEALGELPAEVGFADSSALRVGDFVVAIGNPFGLGQTVTSGIVSAVGRSGLGVEGYEDFIQTDASINPGNSGGALVDLAGRLVGINTAIIAPAGGNVGIGFAIPANMVRRIMAELIAHGEVRRGYVGLRVQPLNRELADAFGIERREGVVITAVDPDSPAARADLRIGDVITAFGQRQVGSATDFHAEAALVMVGEAVPVTLVRAGEPRTLELEVPEDQFEKVEGLRLDRKLAGALLQNFRDRLDRDLGAGVRILEVEQGSLAWRYGLRAGDVIVAANQQPTQNIGQLTQGIQRDRRRIVLRVWRAGQFYFVALR